MLDPNEKKSSEHRWTEPVTIDAVAYGGKGIARKDGKVWFVADAVPGDVVMVRSVSDSGRYGDAEIVETVQPSPLRQEPLCRVAKACGGCQWMGVDYAKQLEWKRGFVHAALSRIGKLDGKLDVTIVGSPAIHGYRNRILVRLHHDGAGPIKLGYFQRSSRNLVALERCEIAAEPLNAVLAAVRAMNLADLPAFKARLELQEVPGENGVPGILSTLHPAEGSREAIATLATRIGALPGVRWSGLIFDLDKAPTVAFDEQVDLRFLTAPGQFQQVNMDLNRRLRELVKAKVEERGAKRILDVFCGSGNLSLALADGERYVEGIESNRQAVAIGRKNAEINLRANVRYLSGDAEKHLWKCDRGGERFDLVILDPPRQGLYKGMVPLKNIGPADIIYVSCDPTTLARDLSYLCRGDTYVIDSVTAFDFFPNTFHVETVVCLRRTTSP